MTVFLQQKLDPYVETYTHTKTNVHQSRSQLLTKTNRISSTYLTVSCNNNLGIVFASCFSFSVFIFWVTKDTMKSLKTQLSPNSIDFLVILSFQKQIKHFKNSFLKMTVWTNFPQKTLSEKHFHQMHHPSLSSFCFWEQKSLQQLHQIRPHWLCWQEIWLKVLFTDYNRVQCFNFTKNNLFIKFSFFFLCKFLSNFVIFWQGIKT